MYALMSILIALLLCLYNKSPLTQDIIFQYGVLFVTYRLHCIYERGPTVLKCTLLYHDNGLDLDRRISGILVRLPPSFCDMDQPLTTPHPCLFISRALGRRLQSSSFSQSRSSYVDPNRPPLLLRSSLASTSGLAVGMYFRSRSLFTPPNPAP